MRNISAHYIGEATAQRLSEDFELRDLGPQTFKNVRESVVVYEVLGQRMLAAV
jgi:class 3 adenylate cyclase